MSKYRISQLSLNPLLLWLFVALVSGIFLFIRTPSALTQSGFAGGAGTENDPYLIATATHLDNVRNYPDAHFRLIADINLGVAPFNEGEGWLPIGPSAAPFTGSFDGDIYVIFNLTSARPTTDYQGLFGYLSGATVENLYLENVSVQGDQYTGGLAGRADNSIIENIQVTGAINGGLYTGGLVGYLAGGSSMGYVSSSATVHGGQNTGGMVGYVSDTSDSIYHAYTLGTVDGDQYSGGLVGRLSRGILTGSYSRAAVSGSDTVGGAVGYIYNGGVYRTYSTGTVTGTNNVGGLAGTSSGTVADSYWDTESSGLATSAGGTGKSTAEMQQQATYATTTSTLCGRSTKGTTIPSSRT
jgi:hypothetical protein